MASVRQKSGVKKQKESASAKYCQRDRRASYERRNELNDSPIDFGTEMTQECRGISSCVGMPHPRARQDL